MQEKLTGTLQENLITLLCHNGDAGRIVAGLADPNLFEGEYRVIAERAIDYWKRHAKPPGSHTADLVAEIIEDRGNRKRETYRRILTSMLALAESINTKYVVDQLRTFTRMQRLKDAILKSAEQLSRQQEFAVLEVEEIWHELLRTRSIDFEPGVTLFEVERVLAAISAGQSEFRTGIEQLDRMNICPARGTAMIFLASTGRGKTWFLVHLGKHALLQRKKVLHISLEMSEEQVLQRYYQSLFSLTKRLEPVNLTNFELDANDRLLGVLSSEHKPDFHLTAPDAGKKLTQLLKAHKRKMQNFIVKRFPPRHITISMLRGYLDNLEIAQGFIPDLLILDYIGITKTDAQNHRISLGRAFEEFRAVCVERNIAGATAGQLNREGANAPRGGATHVAEDWSLIGTADIALTLSSTNEEFSHGLARLYVDKARDERDRFGLLITQNYSIGQFCLESILMRESYQEILDELEDVRDDDFKDE